MSKFKDLTGQVIGWLTVEKYIKGSRKSPAYYVCTCLCGETTHKERRELENKKYKNISCGCHRAVKDLLGERFERLVVVKGEGRNSTKNKGATYWRCICDCGNEKVVETHQLLYGKTKSCGCYAKDKASLNAKIRNSAKEGNSYHKDYKLWTNMIQRCTNPQNTKYANYGGRGIKVCKEWRNDFKAFLNDMGERPDNMELDRIDNNGNYEPSNCRWSTRQEQTRNTRQNHPVAQLDMDGNEIARFNTIAEATEAVNGSYNSIRSAVIGKNKTASGFKWKSLKKES